MKKQSIKLMPGVAFIAALFFIGLTACQTSGIGDYESYHGNAGDPLPLVCTCSNGNYSVAPTVTLAPCPSGNTVNVGPGSTLLMKAAAYPSRSYMNWFLDQGLTYQNAPNGDMDEILIKIGQTGTSAAVQYIITYSAKCIHGTYQSPLGTVLINVHPSYPVYNYRPITQP